jgi:uncharacterized membrane protein YeaQ/YmgE (transglycosylase-associated protein family)
MLEFTLLAIVGILVGLYVRWMFRDKRYSSVADALLGIVGAVGAAWVMASSEMTWSSKATFTIWAAAVLPCIAHFLARRYTSAARQQVRRKAF